MTESKTARLYEFWASFGLPAYEEHSVPTGESSPKFPYITYSVSVGSFGQELAISGSIWYRSSSWVDVDSKAQEISKSIGLGGKIIPCEDGAMILRRGSPFAQHMGDEKDEFIKRIYVNLSCEFVTAD